MIEKNRSKTQVRQAEGIQSRQTSLPWIGGVLFTFLFALLSYGLTYLPGVSVVGPLACAIILAILYRQMFGYPQRIHSGIVFSSKRLLRLAIVLYGLKLNISWILEQGLTLLVFAIFAVLFAILGAILIARPLKADQTLSLLLGVGTGICGAAAIAAVSPLIKAKDEDTALSISIIALVGTVFALVYTALRPLLPFSAAEYGTWSGISLHELAHVALAATPGGDEALSWGLLAKLERVFLLIPVCLILMYGLNWKKKTNTGQGVSVPFPWFLLGFVLMSIVGSYVLGHSIPFPSDMEKMLATITSFVLTMAMVGLGLNVSFKDLKERAVRPLIVMVITSVLLTISTYLLLAVTV